MKTMKLVIVDVQRTYSDYFSGSLVRLLRRASKLADECLVITDDTCVREESLVKGTESAFKQYGGFLRLCIDNGLDEELEECVEYLVSELPMSQIVPEDHPAIEQAERDWPILMDFLRLELGGQFPQIIANEEWVHGIPNSTLMRFDGAILCGGSLSECLAEVELAMKCLGLKTTVDRTLCYE